jgi:endonuclease/exonuclease/phosphatase (EEP) superfamily protein YafD
MFHTPDVFIDELRSLEHFGSDHFPIYAKFFINKNTSKQEHLKEA